MTSPKLKWDSESDPRNPGWVVQTKTAGWQPLGGSFDRDPMPRDSKELQRQALKVLAYHDGGGKNPYKESRQTVTELMHKILAEMEIEDSTDGGGVDTADLIPHLLLVAQTLGVDMQDADAVDEFLAALKKVSTTKAALLKSKMKLWTATKASKAVKSAKASL